MKVYEFMHEMRTTSAILGRQSGISVVFEGTEAKTDGKTIYLPSLPMDMVLTQEQVLAMRGYVDHEAGHNRHSDMPRIISFYDKNSHNERPELSRIHNALEDIWMEDRVENEYVGAYKNLKQCDELSRLHEKRQVEEMGGEEAGKEYFKDPKNQNSATQVSICTSKFKENKSNQYMSNLLTEKQRAMGDHYGKLALECENSSEVIELAKRIYQYDEETPPDEQSPEDFDDKSEAGELDGMAGEDGEGENSPDFDAQKAQEGGSGEAQAMIDGEGEGDTSADGEVNPNTSIQEILNLNEEELEGGGGIGACTDRGLRDDSYRVYSTREDKIIKRGDPNSSHRDLMNDVGERWGSYDQRKTELRAEVMVMKNKLRRAVVARQQRDWDTGREMGRLDSKRLVAAAGGSKTVFKRRTDRDELDTSITMLIDLSGSMKGIKARVARDCAMALAECFEGTQIKYRISGFCNRGAVSGASYSWHNSSPDRYHRYERLNHFIFKDFDEALRTTRGTIYGIPEAVGGNNSDYDFVNSELFTLSRRFESRKILFVLSDGCVACASDAPTSEHERLIRKNVLEHRAKYGIECLGIGILDGSVKRIYPDAFKVNNVEELSSTAFNTLTNILFRDKLK